MRRCAFSLVELLIVLAIIAILAALLFAAFGPSREKARQSVCMSNLQQMRQALTMYQADFDGAEPVEGVRMQDWQLGLPTPPATEYFFDNYIKNKQVLLCPDFIQPVPGPKHMCSYDWCFGPDSDMPRDVQFSRVLARMGQDTPLFICESHNRPFDLANEPRWIQKQVIIMRYSGQVKVKTVPVRDMYPY